MSADLIKNEQTADAIGLSLPDRLTRVQLAQIVHRRRAIVLFDGWEASGRRSALNRVTSAWDSCHYATHCPIPEENERGRHWLAPYWSSLPAAGDTALFHGSWYDRVAGERAAGQFADKVWARRCDEINEFEAQQRDHGTLIVKLFFDVAVSVQAERLAARDADPWRKWLAADEPAGQISHGTRQTAWDDLIGKTDTRWAPWLRIDANDREAGERAALGAIAQAFERAIPLNPPIEDVDRGARAQRAAG